MWIMGVIFIPRDVERGPSHRRTVAVRTLVCLVNSWEKVPEQYSLRSRKIKDKPQRRGEGQGGGHEAYSQGIYKIPVGVVGGRTYSIEEDSPGLAIEL